MTRDDIIEKHSDKFRKEPISGCWIWTAATDKCGYGMVWDGRRMDRAHRVFYSFTYDKPISGLNVLHSCDNPSCVNPAHLRTGNQAENMKDRTERGRSGRRINKYIADHIRLQLSLGRSQRWIADFWGVSQRLVFNIKHGLIWKTTK